MKKLFSIILMVIVSNANAGEDSSTRETSTISTVILLSAYAEYGGGDVIAKLQNNSANCSDGYWLKQTDPGFTANLSMLMAAYQANNSVTIQGHTDQLWPGSGGKYCHVYNVTYK